MQELIIEKIDNTTLKVKYDDYTTFKKEHLDKLRTIAVKALADIDFLLGKFV